MPQQTKPTTVIQDIFVSWNRICGQVVSVESENYADNPDDNHIYLDFRRVDNYFAIELRKELETENKMEDIIREVGWYTGGPRQLELF
jgi:tryptophanase